VFTARYRLGLLLGRFSRVRLLLTGLSHQGIEIDPYILYGFQDIIIANNEIVKLKLASILLGKTDYIEVAPGQSM
jgi:hypothetical protein